MPCPDYQADHNNFEASLGATLLSLIHCLLFRMLFLFYEGPGHSERNQVYSKALRQPL